MRSNQKPNTHNTLPHHTDNTTDRRVIVPLDHGVHDGPISGLVDLGPTLEALSTEGVDGVVLHKGMVRRYRDQIGSTPVLLHISASSHLGRWPLRKVLVASPEEAIDVGAEGVSVHVNLGNEHEPEMLADLGRVGSRCAQLGLPLLAMMYVRRMCFGNVVNITRAKEIAHAARVGAELGASIVKVCYTGDLESFRTVVEGCPVPVVIAGGARAGGGPNEVLRMIRGAIAAGGAGISMGRNVFQHPDMPAMLRDIKRVVYGTSRVTDFAN